MGNWYLFTNSKWLKFRCFKNFDSKNIFSTLLMARLEGFKTSPHVLQMTDLGRSRRFRLNLTMTQSICDQLEMPAIVTFWQSLSLSNDVYLITGSEVVLSIMVINYLYILEMRYWSHCKNKQCVLVNNIDAYMKIHHEHGILVAEYKAWLVIRRM